MRHSVIHRLFWGLILVGIGAVFLLRQIGVLTMDIGDLFRLYWPVILIAVGLQGLIVQPKGGFWWNPIVVLIGVFYLGRNLNWFEWELGDMMKVIGPVILIIWGLGVMTHGWNKRNPERDDADRWNSINPPPMPPPGPDLGPPPPPPMPEGSDYTFEGDAGNAGSAGSAGGIGGTDDPGRRPAGGAAFGGIPRHDPRPKDSQYWKHRYWREHHEKPWRQTWRSQERDNYSRFIGDFVLGQDYFELRPMSISHFIGDTKLDLTRAQIPPGETRIYVSCFIGDVKVFVPDDYSVGVRVVSSSLLGDLKVMNQKRGGIFNQMNVETTGFTEATKQIVLVVSMFIGDVRVTKVG